MSSLNPGETPQNQPAADRAAIRNPVSHLASIEALSSGHILVQPNHAALRDQSEGNELHQILQVLDGKSVILNASNADFLSDGVKGRLISLQKHSEADCCLIANNSNVLEALRIARFESVLPITGTLQDALTTLGISGATVDVDKTNAIYQDITAAQEQLEQEREAARVKANRVRSPQNLAHIEIGQSTNPDTTVLEATGHLTNTVGDERLSAILLRALEGSDNVVLDVTAATSMKTEAIGELLITHTKAKEAGKQLIIVDNSEESHVTQKMRQTKLTDLIKVISAEQI